MPILLARAMLAQQPHFFRQTVVVGGHETSVPRAAEILARKERETAGRANPANHPATLSGADSLTRVLYNLNSMARGKAHDWIENRGVAEQVNRQDRARPRRERRFDERRIHIECARVDVDEDRPRPKARDRSRRREERVRRRDDLVACADP